MVGHGFTDGWLEGVVAKDRFAPSNAFPGLAVGEHPVHDGPLGVELFGGSDQKGLGGEQGVEFGAEPFGSGQFDFEFVGPAELIEHKPATGADLKVEWVNGLSFVEELDGGLEVGFTNGQFGESMQGQGMGWAEGDGLFKPLAGLFRLAQIRRHASGSVKGLRVIGLEPKEVVIGIGSGGKLLALSEFFSEPEQGFDG